MTNVGNNGPSVTEIARRLQRVEDKLDERIVTIDMLNATERLIDAKLANQQVSINDVEKRTARMEASMSKVNFALLGAFLTLLVLIVIQLITTTGRGS